MSLAPPRPRVVDEAARAARTEARKIRNRMFAARTRERRQAAFERSERENAELRARCERLELKCAVLEQQVFWLSTCPGDPFLAPLDAGEPTSESAETLPPASTTNPDPSRITDARDIQFKPALDPVDLA